MHNPKYAMFFDFHTQKMCKGVGSEFDSEKFADWLADCGVDTVGLHAKCNQGFCYYDTKIGTRHPTMAVGQDMFGDAVASCNARGIQVVAYLNCGLSHETAVMHPEWCNISPDGRILHPDLYDIGEVTPYMRVMCMNTPYREYFFSLVREILDKYPVAGFLFDSFNGFPCVCPDCIERMHKEGIDIHDKDAVARFGRASVLRMGEDLSKLVHSVRPDAYTYFLGLGAVSNARLAPEYLECECLPTNPGWGYDLLPISARYYRTLSKGPHMNMTGRFYDWGDFGSLRTLDAILYDLYFGLANGMRPDLSDHMHPTGRLYKGVCKRCKEAFDEVRKYEKWHENAENLVDIGVVRVDGHKPSMVGVTRLLSELMMQFDFIDLNADWSKYKVLVLPDEVKATPEIVGRLKRHYAAGRGVIATGLSGLLPDGADFALPEDFGVKCISEYKATPVYFSMTEEWSENMPELPLAVNAQGYNIGLLPGTQCAGRLVAPVLEHVWDGVYSSYYTPPDKETSQPFATWNGRTAYCSFKLFASYYEAASRELRQIIANFLSRLLPKPLLRVNEMLPTTGRCFVTRQPGRLLVHVLHYVPELRGKMLIVENAFQATNVEIRLRLDGLRPAKCYICPDRQEIPFSVEDDCLTATIPNVNGYALLAAEE